jgi:hypothetical protein
MDNRMILIYFQAMIKKKLGKYESSEELYTSLFKQFRCKEGSTMMQ